MSFRRSCPCAHICLPPTCPSWCPPGNDQPKRKDRKNTCKYSFANRNRDESQRVNSTSALGLNLSHRTRSLPVSIRLPISAPQVRLRLPAHSCITIALNQYAPLTVKSSAPTITGLPCTFALPAIKLLGVQSMISPSALYSIRPARVPCSRRVPGSIRAGGVEREKWRTRETRCGKAHGE
jgi:hypothetical protein